MTTFQASSKVDAKILARLHLIERLSQASDQLIVVAASPAGHQEWRKLLHHFYDPFPTVEHYRLIQNYPAILH